jgi:hypothetical protein
MGSTTFLVWNNLRRRPELAGYRPASFCCARLDSKISQTASFPTTTRFLFFHSTRNHSEQNTMAKSRHRTKIASKAPAGMFPCADR